MVFSFAGKICMRGAYCHVAQNSQALLVFETKTQSIMATYNQQTSSVRLDLSRTMYNQTNELNKSINALRYGYACCVRGV